MKGNFISFIPPPYKEFFKNIYNNGFSISVYGDDLEKSISDTSIIIFSIDSTCSIVNRNIFKKIDGLKTDIEKESLNSIEKKLKEIMLKNNKCTPIDSISFNLIWNRD